MVKINFEAIKKRLGKSFKKYVSERAFPGATVGISSFSDDECKRSILCYGTTDELENLVNENTNYDCASLTKPLVTVMSLLALVEEKKISWKEKIGSLLPFPVSKDKGTITLVDLMSHSSGLPAHRPYYKYLLTLPPEARKREVVKLILNENLLHSPGEKNIYSDLGYILLGYIIEEISGMDLDEFWLKKIAEPLSLQETAFFNKKEKSTKKIFAPTGYCPFTNKKLYGIAHDDNCRILGGVAGHAGLFGTVGGILSICENILLGYCSRFKHPSFSNKNLRFVLEKKENSSWTPGFDTPSPIGSSSGKYFSRKSVGHLGFTGTSFWIDLHQKIIVVFLSNRVFFGVENEKIKKIRPIIHDIIMEGLIDE